MIDFIAFCLDSLDAVILAISRSCFKEFIHMIDFVAFCLSWIGLCFTHWMTGKVQSCFVYIYAISTCGYPRILWIFAINKSLACNTSVCSLPRRLVHSLETAILGFFNHRNMGINHDYPRPFQRCSSWTYPNMNIAAGRAVFYSVDDGENTITCYIISTKRLAVILGLFEYLPRGVGGVS